MALVCGCSPEGFLNLLITTHKCSKALWRCMPLEKILILSGWEAVGNISS